MVQRDIMWTLSFVVVTVATVTLALNHGPNDPRYPDEIVDPRVKCQENGDFPHPTNCSWFVRCLDRFGVGFYFTYYFQCANGTVFSDESDLCLPADAVPPPCGSYLGTNVAPPIDPPVTPDVNPDRPRVPCRFVDSMCEHYEVCLPVRKTLELCYACYVATALVNASTFCTGQNQVLDRNLSICVSPPEESSLCAAATGRDLMPSMKHIHCSDENPRPKDSWILENLCTKFSFCESGLPKGARTLCEGYFECHRAEDGSWVTRRMKCNDDHMFSYDEDACKPNPSASELCTA